MELEDCGPGCDCGKSSGNTKVKVVVCLIVLLAVGTILAYKANSTSQTAPSNADTAFAAPLINQDAAESTTVAQTTTVPAADTASPQELYRSGRMKRCRLEQIRNRPLKLKHQKRKSAILWIHSVH